MELFVEENAFSESESLQPLEVNLTQTMLHGVLIDILTVNRHL